MDSFRHRGDSLRITQDPNRYDIFTHDLTTPISDRLINKIGHIDYIINMASESHVDRSITDPVSFCENNFKLALTMLEYARKVKPEFFIQISTDEVYGAALNSHNHKEWETILPSNPYSGSKAAQEAMCISYWRTFSVPVVITNCFSMDSNILTENGLKNYDSIKEGDNVWTLDENENFILTEVLEKIKMPSNNEMIYINTPKVNQLVTPNHRMMIKKPKGKPRKYGEIEECQAESLLEMKGRVRIPTIGKWNGEKMDDKYILGDADEYIMSTIYGWYVSEGYYVKNENTVCFGAGSKKQQDILINLLSYIGKPYINGRSVRITNKELRVIVEEFGTLAINKKIPDFIKKIKTESLIYFLNSAIDGDGSVYNKIYNNRKVTATVYYTKSEKLVEDMLEIGIKCGYAVRCCKRKTWNPLKTLKSESFIVRFRLPVADIEKSNISKIKYNDNVWCIKTKTGKVFIERNGIVSLSGQTMNMVGEKQDSEKFLPMLINRINAGQEVTIHGNKDVIGSRYYLHARNHADALLFIIENTKPTMYRDCMNEIIVPDRYNIVGEREIDNLSLAKMVADILDKPLIYRLEDFHEARPGHDRRYALDGTKLKNLGWKAPISFKQTLEKTIEWTLQRPEWLK